MKTILFAVCVACCSVVACADPPDRGVPDTPGYHQGFLAGDFGPTHDVYGPATVDIIRSSPGQSRDATVNVSRHVDDQTPMMKFFFNGYPEDFGPGEDQGTNAEYEYFNDPSILDNNPINPHICLVPDDVPDAYTYDRASDDTRLTVKKIDEGLLFTFDVHTNAVESAYPSEAQDTITEFVIKSEDFQPLAPGS